LIMVSHLIDLSVRQLQAYVMPAITRSQSKVKRRCSKELCSVLVLTRNIEVHCSGEFYFLGIRKNIVNGLWH
jgi:hypothetical protein